MAIKDIVAKNKRAGFAANEAFTDQERLGKTARMRLRPVRKIQAELAAIAKKLLEQRQVFGRGYDENVANARQHQCAERIINHWFIEDGKELFRNHHRAGVKAASSPPGQYDSSHNSYSTIGYFSWSLSDKICACKNCRIWRLPPVIILPGRLAIPPKALVLASTRPCIASSTVSLLQKAMSANAWLFSESPFKAAVCGLLLSIGSAGDSPIQGDTHDQDQPFETIRLLDMALHQTKTARFKVGEHAFDAPSHAVIERRITRRHRPRLAASRQLKCRFTQSVIDASIAIIHGSL